MEKKTTNFDKEKRPTSSHAKTKFTLHGIHDHQNKVSLFANHNHSDLKKHKKKNNHESGI